MSPRKVETESPIKRPDRYCMEELKPVSFFKAGSGNYFRCCERRLPLRRQQQASKKKLHLCHQIEDFNQTMSNGVLHNFLDNWLTSKTLKRFKLFCDRSKTSFYPYSQAFSTVLQKTSLLKSVLKRRLKTSLQVRARSDDYSRCFQIDISSVVQILKLNFNWII